MDAKKNKFSSLSTIAFLIINALFLWGTWQIGNTLDRVEQHLKKISAIIADYRKP